MHVSSNAIADIAKPYVYIASDYIMLLNCYSIYSHNLKVVKFGNIYNFNTEKYLKITVHAQINLV